MPLSRFPSPGESLSHYRGTYFTVPKCPTIVAELLEVGVVQPEHVTARLPRPPGLQKIARGIYHVNEYPARVPSHRLLRHLPVPRKDACAREAADSSSLPFMPASLSHCWTAACEESDFLRCRCEEV